MQMFNMFANFPSKKLSVIDKFRMPVIDLDYTRSYKEMLNLKFANDGFEDYIIQKMDERLKLKVTKFGVTIESQAAVMIFLTSSYRAKYFYVDNDFWLVFKEKNKQPYLVVHVTSVSETWTEWFSDLLTWR